MAWVHFVRDFTFTPEEDRRVSTKYLAGRSYSVRRSCADLAIALQAAKAVRTPGKTNDPGE